MKFHFSFVAKATAFINGTLTTNDLRTPLDPKRQRRATEREARRYLEVSQKIKKLILFLSLRRRKDREQTSTQHFDGMSTDDEENQSDINLFSTQKRKNKEIRLFEQIFFIFILEEILNEAEHILDDVSEEFSQYRNVKTIFEQWKYQQNESYTDAFIEICLPKLFSPLIRREMIDWKPFEVINKIKKTNF